jgi:hypothetical protein
MRATGALCAIVLLAILVYSSHSVKLSRFHRGKKARTMLTPRNAEFLTVSSESVHVPPPQAVQLERPAVTSFLDVLRDMHEGTSSSDELIESLERLRNSDVLTLSSGESSDPLFSLDAARVTLLSSLARIAALKLSLRSRSEAVQRLDDSLQSISEEERHAELWFQTKVEVMEDLSSLRSELTSVSTAVNMLKASMSSLDITNIIASKDTGGKYVKLLSQQLIAGNLDNCPFSALQPVASASPIPSNGTELA